MKKRLLLIFALSIFISLCNAQNPILWGMTPVGGRGGGDGNIFKFNPADSTVESEFSFYQYNSKLDASGNLIQASNGLLYGMTIQGGIYGEGTIFSYDTSTGKQTVLHSFGSGADGAYPNGSLIQANNGLLYGMTTEGGDSELGMIFSYDISTGNYNDIHDFSVNPHDGVLSYGSLVQASNGLLYGMTSGGGSGGGEGGIIFSYNISTNTETDIHDFGTGTDGTKPYGSLMQANDGLLYGMTSKGGDSAYGMIFTYNIVSGTETDIYDFGTGIIDTDGSSPYGSFVQANNDLLYGMTYTGGSNGSGTIFSYNISTKKENVLYSFGSLFSFSDGYYPDGSLIQASDGLLYGMTYNGGINNTGTIFNYNISTNSENVLHNFSYYSNTDGYLPQGSFMQSKNGLLYGITSLGGDDGVGVILSYNISDDSENILYNFDFVQNGQVPYGSLIKANNGLLYGLTEFGGPGAGNGTIFSYDMSTNIETDLYNFIGPEGTLPHGTLIQANNGLLYGLAQSGGANGRGTIFSYNILLDTLIDIHDFSKDSDGVSPGGKLIQASNGLLYGMTPEGGAYDTSGGYGTGGTLFSYDISNDAYVVLHNFGGINDGAVPWGSLMQANNGLIYGMTSQGGANGTGIIFSYDISTGALTDVNDFGSGTAGGEPYSSLFQANDGLLYGTTEYGGTYYEGTFFSFDISNSNYTDIYDFTYGYPYTDGNNPVGAIIQASNGLL